MPEVKEKVDTFSIKMMCDKCGIGEMILNGDCFMGYTPFKYSHKCTNINCSNIENYIECYPKTVYE